MSRLTDLRVPVFLAEGKPSVDVATWRLQVGGLIDNPRTLSLAEIKTLPSSRVDARLTSVSGWSV